MSKTRRPTIERDPLDALLSIPSAGPPRIRLTLTLDDADVFGLLASDFVRMSPGSEPWLVEVALFPGTALGLGVEGEPLELWPDPT